MININYYLSREDTQKHLLISFKVLFQFINELMEIKGESNFNSISYNKLSYSSKLNLFDICYRLKLNDQKLFDCIIKYKLELIYDTPFKVYNEDYINKCIESIQFINDEYNIDPIFKYNDLYNIIKRTHNIISDRLLNQNLAYDLI